MKAKTTSITFLLISILALTGCSALKEHLNKGVSLTPQAFGYQAEIYIGPVPEPDVNVTDPVEAPEPQ